MPVSSEDLAEARRTIEAVHQQARESFGKELPPPTDEAVARRAAFLALERDPGTLTLDEVRALYEGSREIVREVRQEWAVDASGLLAAAAALDARGALAGPPAPPENAAERRAWALDRVGRLGEIAWSDENLPPAFRAWLKERSVATLRDAGPDRPTWTALRTHCAQWSWSASEAGELFTTAFPPPPAEVARHDSAVVFAQQVVYRVRARRAAGRDAEALLHAAGALFTQWFDEPGDDVQQAARATVEKLLDTE